MQPVHRRAAAVAGFLLLARASGGGPAAAVAPAARAGAAAPAPRFPSYLLVTVDTLRPDRLSGYGYRRPTSPALDALMASGARFAQARTPEPLTGPALASLITTLAPHEHGATRNGLGLRPGLPSFAKLLARRGYATAAFVGNWTLRDRISGLGEHFEVYREVLDRKRWVFLKGEATADDLNEEALGWFTEQLAREPRRPLLLWVHYVEPHAPYVLHEELLSQLGLAGERAGFSPKDRYDTEIAYVDRAIGRLLAAVRERLDPASTLVAFAADHGESLGEHGYWGHGRHLWDGNLRIPMAIAWPARLRPQVIDAPALLTDLPSTLFGLAGLPVPDVFRGFDWSGVLSGEVPAPAARVTTYQAHKGAVLDGEERSLADRGRLRRRGLLEVARMVGLEKEGLRIDGGRRRLYEVASDPGETANRVPEGSPPTPELEAWRAEVEQGLARADSLSPPQLSDDDLEALQALGYVD